MSDYANSNTDFFSRNFLSVNVLEENNGSKRNKKISFHQLHDLAAEYLACMDIVEGDSCQEAVDYLSINVGSLYESDDSLPTYALIVCMFIVLGMFALVFLDVRSVRLAYVFDRDLWNIYLDDQNQNREIVNAIREEESDDSNQEEEVHDTNLEIDVGSPNLDKEDGLE